MTTLRIIAFFIICLSGNIAHAGCASFEYEGSNVYIKNSCGFKLNVWWSDSSNHCKVVTYGNGFSCLATPDAYSREMITPPIGANHLVSCKFPQHYEDGRCS